MTPRGAGVGTFTCTQCGFSYARTGLDVTLDDQQRIDRMRQFGPVWEAALREAWADPALGLRATARMLGVDPRTVLRQAERLGLEVVSSAPPKSTGPTVSAAPSVPAEEVRDQYRQAWEMACQPAYGTTAARRAAPAAYAWLRRHDRAWLETHCPPAAAAKRTAASRIDWGQRDAEWVERVTAAITELANSPRRPVRITVAAIERMAGRPGYLQKRMAKLPHTAALVIAGSESSEGFARRRLAWAVNDLHAEGQPLVAWRIVRRAALRPTSIDPRWVEEALQADGVAATGSPDWVVGPDERSTVSNMETP